MGTNYYAQEKRPCLMCRRPYHRRHIGKSSAGWQFLFASWEEDSPKTKAEWVKALAPRSVRIFDEYGRTVPKAEFWKLVDTKQKRDGTHYLPGEDPSRHEHRDPEGYRFSDREFS